MKGLLIVLLIGLCGIAWRADDILRVVSPASFAEPAPRNVAGLHAPAQSAKQPMTAAEFMELSNTDPHAYQKYLNSHVAEPAERSRLDKLLHFLARGTYE